MIEENIEDLVEGNVEEDKDKKIINQERAIRLLKEQLKKTRDDIKEIKKTRTSEIQQGSFQRKIIRVGDKKREKTVRFVRNPQKIVFDTIGALQLYCYVTNPNGVSLYVGLKDNWVLVDNYDYRRFMKWFNIGRWVYEGDGLNSSLRGESRSKYAKRIRAGYKAFIEEMKEKANKRRK